MIDLLKEKSYKIKELEGQKGKYKSEINLLKADNDYINYDQEVLQNELEALNITKNKIKSKSSKLINDLKEAIFTSIATIISITGLAVSISNDSIVMAIVSFITLSGSSICSSVAINTYIKNKDFLKHNNISKIDEEINSIEKKSSLNDLKHKSNNEKIAELELLRIIADGKIRKILSELKIDEETIAKDYTARFIQDEKEKQKVKVKSNN